MIIKNSQLLALDPDEYFELFPSIHKLAVISIFEMDTDKTCGLIAYL